MYIHHFKMLICMFYCHLNSNQNFLGLIFIYFQYFTWKIDFYFFPKCLRHPRGGCTIGNLFNQLGLTMVPYELTFVSFSSVKLRIVFSVDSFVSLRVHMALFGSMCLLLHNMSLYWPKSP